MAKKINTPLVSNTLFNVQPIHVARIKAYINAGHSPIIIHGDGHMFAGKLAQEGSDHHKEFNSGVAEINKDEVISRAKFRAVYKKGDELPTTPEDVIQEFYDNQARELQNITKAEINTGFSNAITISDPELESDEPAKKAGRPAKNDQTPAQ
jgi:hypothetical protein